MIAPRALLLLAATLSFASNCKPENKDLGEPVLFVWPFVALFAFLVQRFVLTLWKPLLPKLRLDARAVLIGIGVTLAAPISIAALAKSDNWCLWAIVMAWMFGASYTSVLLVLTRILLFFDERAAELGAHILTSCAFIPPAIMLTFDRWPASFPALVYFWVVGYGGLATSGVLTVLVLEVTIRRIRLNATSPAAEEAPPRAEG